MDGITELSCKNGITHYGVDGWEATTDVVFGSPSFSLARRQARAPAPRCYSG